MLAQINGPASSAYAAQWLFQRSLAVFGILLCSQALVLLYPNPDAASSLTASNRLFRILSAATYGTATFWLLPRLGVIQRVACANAWLLILISLALVSSLWSQVPEVSARRAAALVLNFTFTLYLVLRFPPVKLLRLVFIALTASALASLAVVAIAPEVGIHQESAHAAHGAASSGTRTPLDA